MRLTVFERVEKTRAIHVIFIILPSGLTLFPNFALASFSMMVPPLLDLDLNE